MKREIERERENTGGIALKRNVKIENINSNQR